MGMRPLILINEGTLYLCKIKAFIVFCKKK